MLGVGEMLVVVRVCLKLGNLLAQLGPLWNLRKDMESMHSTMLTILAVLSDAEMRSLRKEAKAERVWLQKLKSAAYKIEDLLSDFEASIPPNMAGRLDRILQQLKLFCSSSNPIKSYLTWAHKMKNMREILDQIASEKRDFHFMVDSDQVEGRVIKNRETFSEIDLTETSKIVGRDEEKKKIINFLLQKDVGEDISIISIVGLGGLGKTTLVQLVYNDECIKKQFDAIAWVHVSMNFDLLKIRKKILSQVGNGGQYDDSLQSVTTRLKSVLSDKRLLIVLDDLWGKVGEKLNTLKLMLKGGRSGSKVLVTTRSEKVALFMSARNMVHYLKGLSNEDCWCIFSQKAFISGDDVDSSLVEVGKEIIKKSKGVPLAAIALGYILHDKKDINTWLAVRDSEFWELEEDDSELWELEEDDSVLPSLESVLPSLKLSYYHLRPAPLKLCFAYCAIFPKGSNINKDRLIQQWIALDLIKKKNANYTLEMTGEEYVSILLGMSFLQYSPNHDKSHNLLCMHDLVHDLAKSIVGDEMILLDARKKINENRNLGTGYSYYSLLANYDNGQAPLDWKLLPDKIRALHITNCTPILFPKEVFSKMRSLRALSWSGCNMENLPEWVYDLKQLRYLQISVVNETSLPESLKELLNLETVDLSRSSLQTLPISISKLDKLKNLILHGCSFLGELPESFSKLKNLTHLDLSDCCSLQILPESFGNLSKLCFLQLSCCSKLQKLPESIFDLTSLIHLDISGCSSLKLLPATSMALSKLQFFCLSGCSELEKLPELLVNIKGLQHLNLSDCISLRQLPESFGNICKLKILDLSGCYELRNLPESFKNLENMEFLNLSQCSKLEELPEYLGNLKNLKSLNLSSCNALRKLPTSFCRLVKLEKIDVSYCCNLEEFPESVVTSGNLQMLNLRGCSSLAEFTETAKSFMKSQKGFILLEDAKMFECKDIRQGGKRCNTVVMLEDLNQIRGELCITHIETLQSSEEAERAKLCNKSKLHSLTLQWSNSTCELAEDAKMDELMLEKLQPHQILNMLTVDGYRGTRLSGWIMELHCSLPNLTKITLCNLPHCEQLPPFEHLTNLETLEIHNALKIKGIQTDLQAPSGLFRKLKTLSIRDMPELKEWSIIASSNDIKLDSLEIYRCPLVIFRPCLPSTKTSVIIGSGMSLSPVNAVSLSSMYIISKMYIEGCSITSDEWGGLRHYVVKDLEINSCDELYCLPKGIEGLTSLESLTVNDCNWLSILPEWLGECISLKTLSINRCSNLKSIRGSFGKLKILSIRDMPNLEEWSITGSASDTKLERIEIYRCPRVILGPCLPSTDTLVITESSMSLSSGSIASLSSKSIISKMCIESGGITSDEWGGLSHYVIRDLEIKSCGELYYLPKGIEGLTSLESLTINDCNCLSALPEWLGECISLKSLSINRCSNLKSIRGSFRKLNILSIRDMPNLEEWSITGSASDTKLERIEIYRCPRVILGPCLPSTDTLVITESSMSLSSGSVASLSSKSIISKMCIESCGITSDEWGGLSHYVIRDLEIKSCGELYFLPKGIEGLMTSLESLTINNCNCLSALPEWLGDQSTSLRSLSVSWCPNLNSLPLSVQCPTALENLDIRDCYPELEDRCEGVNWRREHGFDPHNLIFFLLRKEEIYGLEDIHTAPKYLITGIGDTEYEVIHIANLKGRDVMVKRLNKVNVTEREFRDKICVIGAMNHPNLLPLVAYYYNMKDNLLVYDFMNMGSLYSWLHGVNTYIRNWSSRYRIALAVAHGLKYIHATSPQYAHGNIRSSNILLSGNNGFPDEAKIAGYGLVHLTGNLADAVYKAPEVTDFHQATQKSDVYSFGVLLLELLTGKDPGEHEYYQNTSLPVWVQQFHGTWLPLLDTELRENDQIAQQEMTNMMQLAMDCVSSEPERRPTMEKVVHQIEDIFELMKDRPGDTGSSIDDSGEGPSTRTDL